MSELIDRQATEGQTTEWWNLVARFKEAAARVDQVLDTLRGQEAAARQSPGLSAEYDQVMRRAAELRATIADLLARISGAVDWVRGAGDWFSQTFGLSGLGVVPVVIGVAAITAALAAVTKFLTDAWSLSKRIDEQIRLEGQGLTPQEAAAVVERSTQSSAGRQFLVSMIPFGAIALVGYMIWRQTKNG